MKEIYQLNGKTLFRTEREHKYIVMFGFYMVDEIWADNDRDAIEQFEEGE